MSAARAVPPEGPPRAPVTTPAVVRLVPAPTAEPPAEGPDWPGPHTPRPSHRRPAEPRGRYVQGSLAVDFRQAAHDNFFGPQATGTADLPPAELWARKLVQATLEVCDGTRSADQLTRWLAPDVRERVARRGVLARRRVRRPHRPPVIRAVLLCHPADGVCEVSAVVHASGRIRALALRMSGVDGRWLVTALELG